LVGQLFARNRGGGPVEFRLYFHFVPSVAMGGPNNVTRGKDGNFYIPEQEDEGKPAYVGARHGQGNVLARLESRHVHGVGVDSRGDIYAGLTAERSVDKFVRIA
jgi:hypothetical protein